MIAKYNRGEEKLRPRPCERCKKDFVPNVPNRKYCTDRCRIEVSQESARTQPSPRICCVCGKKFLGLGQRKICSEKCVSDRKERKNKARGKHWKGNPVTLEQLAWVGSASDSSVGEMLGGLSYRVIAGWRRRYGLSEGTGRPSEAVEL